MNHYPKYSCCEKPMTRLEQAQKDLNDAIKDIPANKELEDLKTKTEVIRAYNIALKLNGSISSYVPDVCLQNFLVETYKNAGYTVFVSSGFISIS